MVVVFKFLITVIGIAFATGSLLAIYEGIKPGGLKKECERQIVIFSLILGIIAALTIFGLIGGRTGPHHFE